MNRGHTGLAGERVHRRARHEPRGGRRRRRF